MPTPTTTTSNPSSGGLTPAQAASNAAMSASGNYVFANGSGNQGSSYFGSGSFNTATNTLNQGATPWNTPKSTPPPVGNTVDGSNLGTSQYQLPVSSSTSNSNAFVGSLPTTQTAQTVDSTSTAGAGADAPQVPPWKKQFMDTYQGLMSKLGMEGSEYQNLQSQYQVPQITQELAGIRGTIAQRNAQYLQQWQGAAGEHAALPYITGEQTQIQRTQAVELGVLTAQEQALSGNLQAANDIIDKSIQHEFDPIKNQLSAMAQFYQLNQNDLSESDKLKLSSQYDMMKFNAEQLFSAKKDAYTNAVANNAPPQVISALSQANSLQDIASAGGQYIAPMQTDVVNANGRQLLVNKRTGSTIKDLGAAPLNSYTYSSTPEGQAAIDAISSGKIDPQAVNSRNLPIFGKLFSQNPNFNAVQANAAANFYENKDTQTKLAWAATTEKDFTTLKSLSDSVPRTQYPLINKALLAGQTSIEGNPQATAFLQASNRVAASLSNVLGDSGGSDFRTKLANGVLDPTFSSATFDKVLATESQLISNLTSSFKEQGGQQNSAIDLSGLNFKF